MLTFGKIKIIKKSEYCAKFSFPFFYFIVQNLTWWLGIPSSLTIYIPGITHKSIIYLSHIKTRNYIINSIFTKLKLVNSIFIKLFFFLINEKVLVMFSILFQFQSWDQFPRYDKKEILREFHKIRIWMDEGKD